jgi:hypothetical protein
MSKNTSLIWQISFNGQRCDLQIHHCFLNDRPIACSWYIKNRKKPRSWSFYFLFKIFQTRDIIHSEKKWDLLWRKPEIGICLLTASRDGRQVLDAGGHLSDKCTLLMKTHISFQTQYNIFYQIRFCFYKWWKNNRFYYF